MGEKTYSLQPYLAAGILQAGAKLLSVEVAGKKFSADLGRNGEIFFEGVVFGSPSAFSLYVRRKINPSRRADDGWASVKFDGNILDSYRGRLDPTAKRSTGSKVGKTSSPQTGPRGKHSRKANGSSSASPSLTVGDDPVVPDAMGSNGSVETPQGKGRPVSICANSTPNPLTTTELWGEREGLDDGLEGGIEANGQPDCEEAMPEWHPGDETWVSCDTCHKWRRIKSSLVTDKTWFCGDNPDRRYASCNVPQELSDNAIDKLLEEEHFHTYVQSSDRAPLDQCGSERFEADLIAFLKQLGEDNKAEQLRTKRIQCNNRSLDIFGLYREVIQVGGLINNEAYDETGRWVGQVNFAGHVFPKLLNYTKDHRATSVGNQLLTNYRKYLYDYERAWRHIDLPRCYQINKEGMPKHPKRVRKGSNNRTKGVSSPSQKAGTPSDGANPVDAGAPTSRDFETRKKGRPGKAGKQKQSPVSDARNGGGTVEAVTPDQTQNNSVAQGSSDESEKQRDRSGGSTGLSGSSSRRCGALLMLAGIMSDQDQGAGSPMLSRQLETCGPSRPNRGPWRTKRRKVRHVDPKLLAAATNSSDSTRWWGTGESPAVGELLSARDPSKPGMLWPVLVASHEDLPEAVSGGHANDSARSTGFPFEHKDLSSCRGPCIPVLVFGSNFLGWVPRVLCEPFDRESANVAYSSLLQKPSQDSLSQNPLSQSSVSCTEHTILSRRLLKFALQYYPVANADNLGRQMVQQISLQYIGDRLLDLESDLPTDVLGNSSFATWAEWRKRVSRVESPLSLASECLMLGYQLESSVLKSGASSYLRPTLDALLGTGRSCCEPTIRSVDKAVTLLVDSIDWEKALGGPCQEGIVTSTAPAEPSANGCCEDDDGHVHRPASKDTIKGKRKRGEESL